MILCFGTKEKYQQPHRAKTRTEPLVQLPQLSHPYLCHNQYLTTLIKEKGMCVFWGISLSYLVLVVLTLVELFTIFVLSALVLRTTHSQGRKSQKRRLASFCPTCRFHPNFLAALPHHRALRRTRSLKQAAKDPSMSEFIYGYISFPAVLTRKVNVGFLSCKS